MALETTPHKELSMPQEDTETVKNAKLSDGKHLDDAALVLARSFQPGTFPFRKKLYQTITF